MTMMMMLSLVRRCKPACCHRSFSSLQQLWNPTEEHAALRESLRTFVQREVSVFVDCFLLISGGSVICS